MVFETGAEHLLNTGRDEIWKQALRFLERVEVLPPTDVPLSFATGIMAAVVVQLIDIAKTR